MGHYLAYLESQAVSRNDPSFHALLFAMIRTSDEVNLAYIERAWPWAVDEFKQRRAAPGGALTEKEAKFLKKSTISRADRWPKRS